MSIENAVQAAVIARLRDSAALSALLAPHSRTPTLPAIYDAVPQPRNPGKASDFPYVVVGEDTFNAWDTDDSLGADATITIHAWSRQGGRKETKDIQGAIYAALHRAEFPIAGYGLVGVDWEFSESMPDPDGVTRHGVQRFRLLLEQ